MPLFDVLGQVTLELLTRLPKPLGYALRVTPRVLLGGKARMP